MRITKIRVLYKIKLPADKKAEAERALSVHERGCPAAMSVKDCIAIEWSAELEHE